MRQITVMLCVAVFCGAAAVGSAPPVPDTPAAVDELVYARPFTLEAGYNHYWSKERPWTTKGMLLVLKVDKKLVVPRQIAMPVLYVGDQPAQRINHGDKSGYVIAVVPGEVDLTKVPIWFGEPGLPPDVDANTAKAQRTLAENAGFKPLPAKQVKAALERGGKTAHATDFRSLLRDDVAELILRYSPDERKRAEDFRVPVVKRSAKTTKPGRKP
jgi:hypothetical protein